MPLPLAGEPFPQFTLPDQDGNQVTLSQFAGSPVVLFVYPRADTPGCTVEACGFRDTFERLRAAGVVVLGMSRDTVRAQKKFAEKYSIPYPLLADADQQVIRSMDLIREKKMYGKPVTGVARTTFLIGPDQRLLRIFADVKPDGHAEQVLASLSEAGIASA